IGIEIGGANRRRLGWKTKAGHSQSGRPVVGGHQPDRIRTLLARQAYSGRGVLNITREKQIEWRAKVIFVLQKEWTLLGKVHLESLIHRDLRVLRLDLAEIRIRSQIQHKVVMNHELRIHARL